MYSIIALIRFSFLASDAKGYRQSRWLSFNEKKDLLFASPRLETRFRVFEQICLPTLAAQPSDRFYAIVLASELMPAHYKERLEALLAPYGNVAGVFAEPQPLPYTQAFLSHLEGVRNVDDLILTCRLDDDDGLASHYTESAIQYVDPAHLGYCVSFPRGIQVATGQGKPPVFWESLWPLVGAGLGFIHRLGSGQTIYTCGHHQRLWTKYPTIVDGRLPQYMVTHHGENDSTPRRSLLDRMLRRHRQDHPQRNPPQNKLSLEKARAAYGYAFPPLDDADWSFRT